MTRANVLVIDLNPREQTCHRCQKVTPLGWGLPVDDSGLIVPNWYEGEWAGVAACRQCFEAHERWSDKTMSKVSMPSQLTGEAKEKFDLLKEHFKGVFELLKALGHCGYRPDDFTAVSLDEAVNTLYGQVEEGRL